MTDVAGGAGPLDAGDRGVHRAPSASGSTSTTANTQPARGRAAGLEPDRGAGVASCKVSVDARSIAGHGLPDRRGLLHQRPRPRPLREPRAPAAARRRERRLRSAQDRGGDARRRRRDQPARRVRPGGGRRRDLVRRPRVAPAPQRPALRDADGNRRRAPPREPPQGPLPPEREPRAAHAADGDRRMDGPLRGGRRSTSRRCGAGSARSGSRRGSCSP